MLNSSDRNEYRIDIPNGEIKECFKARIMDFYKNNTDMKKSALHIPLPELWLLRTKVYIKAANSKKKTNSQIRA